MQSLPTSQTIDIDSLDQGAIETHIRDLALLTLTNVEDWNFRFLAAGDPRKSSDKDLICFTHPTAEVLRYVPVLAFMRPQATEKADADVEIRFHGTIALFEPKTRRAWSWMEAHVLDPIWLGPALVIEQRFAKELAQGMKADRLRIA